MLDVFGPGDPAVLDAVDEIARAPRQAGCPVGVFANSAEQVTRFTDVGVTLFLMQSDHAFPPCRRRRAQWSPSTTFTTQEASRRGESERREAPKPPATLLQDLS